MRRPVMYLAGLLLATGASLALAGPASAAPAHHPGHCHHNNGFYGDDDYFWGPDGDITNTYVNHTDYQSHNSWSLLAITGLLGTGAVTGQ